MLNNKTNELKKEMNYNNEQIQYRLKEIEKTLLGINNIGKMQNKAFCSVCGEKLINIYPKSDIRIQETFTCTKRFEYLGIFGYCNKCGKEIKICENEE